MTESAPPAWWSLASADAYRAWRAAVLQTSFDLSPIAVADLSRLQPEERAALLARLHAIGAVRYRAAAEDPGGDGVRALGAQLGLAHADRHPGADARGVAKLEVRDDMARYIPYTDRRLRWHTDGYYRGDAARVRAFVLHCVRDAARGGGNLLLDPRRLYIALRDEEPDWIRALAHPRAFSIPAAGANGAARKAYAGPVFSLDGERLYMRFTERSRHIAWRPDCAGARARIAELLGSLPAAPLRLRPGEGLIAHNVLHCRSAFEDDPKARRLLYRIRYADYAAPPC